MKSAALILAILGGWVAYTLVAAHLLAPLLVPKRTDLAWHDECVQGMVYDQVVCPGGYAFQVQPGGHWEPMGRLTLMPSTPSTP